MNLRHIRVCFALVLALAFALGWTADAQEAPTGGPPRETTAKAAKRPGQDQAHASDQAATNPEWRKLPNDQVTKHMLTLSGQSLAFTATAGSIRLYSEKGEPQADIAFTAYQLDNADRSTRPVTFFLNGGPGASSGWLQFGAAGPWRLALNTTSASAPPTLTPNADSWLDFSDLVFIDPVGTGFSRFVASGSDVHRQFYSVEGDVSALSLVIRRWLEKADRLTSPKYVVGESYGGIRVPRIVRDLQSRQGVGIKGLILVSPLFDYREFGGSSLLQYVYRLPTMTAIARQREKPVTRADLADVEAYATTGFLVDLLKGEADKEATIRLADKVAALTGVDQAVSRRIGGRFDADEFRREFDRKNGRVIGRYDGSVSGFDPFPDYSASRIDDPSLEPLLAPLTSAAVDFYATKLNFRPEGSYEVLNNEVARAWDYGRDRSDTQSLTQLRESLASDPGLKLLVAHGLFDLATPYFGSQIELDQLPPSFATADRVKLVVYPGGHMFYSRDTARANLRDEARALVK